MNNFRAVLTRLSDNGTQTLGRLVLYNNLDDVFNCTTLELSFNANLKNISCIPTGTYKVTPRYSKKYDNHYLVNDVIGRDYILIHVANYYYDLKGCIGVGSDFYDINKDGEHDITSSRATLKKLKELAPDGFELIII